MKYATYNTIYVTKLVYKITFYWYLMQTYCAIINKVYIEAVNQSIKLFQLARNLSLLYKKAVILKSNHFFNLCHKITLWLEPEAQLNRSGRKQHQALCYIFEGLFFELM